MTAPSKPDGFSKDGMRSALDVLETATGLLRGATAADWFYYAVGTLPFLWNFVWFWAEMSRGAHASRRLWQHAFTLALCYVWMKMAQTLFVQRLLLMLRDESRRWTWRELLRMVLRAAVIQTSALPVTCFASCLLIPTAWTFAFYHHAQCSTDPDQKDTLTTLRAALAQSQLWPRQNHTMLSLHAAFGLTVFLNVWVLLVLLPQLLHSLLGIETRYLSSAASPYNSTLLAVAFALTWALADPWLKAAYAVRAFRAQAVTTGRDLTVAWRKSLSDRLAGVVVLVLVMALPKTGFAEAAAPITVSPREVPAMAQTAPAEDEAAVEDAEDSDDEVVAAAPMRNRESLSPEAQKLDRKLDEVLERPTFSFRQPRVAAEEEPDEEPSWFRMWLSDTASALWNHVESAVKWVVRVISWLLGLGESSSQPANATSGTWGKVADSGTVLLAVVVVVVPLVLLFRRKWRARGPQTLVVAGVASQPVSGNEGLEAAKLPESEWNAQAEQLLLAGERRLALRALFLGNLACLIHAGQLVPAAHKSVGDYRRDLERRAHVHPGAFQGYCGTARVFEAVWYGNHPVTDESLEQFSFDTAMLRRDV